MSRTTLPVDPPATPRAGASMSRTPTLATAVDVRNAGLPFPVSAARGLGYEGATSSVLLKLVPSRSSSWFERAGA